MPDVQIAEGEVSELQGKGIDVLTSHVVDEMNAKSASNDPADAEAAAQAKVEEEAKAKADAEAKAAAEGKAKPADEGMQKRVNELTKARRTAERTAAAAEAERQRVEAENAQLREQLAKAPKPEPQKEPKREDFESNEDFTRALVKHEAALRDLAAEEKSSTDAKAKAETQAKEEAERRAVEAATAAAERFAERQKAAREKYADYDSVIANPEIILSRPLAFATLNSELSGELQYHFGKNPEVVERLNGLDQASMLKELGKIELSLAPNGGDGAVDQPRGEDGKFVPTKKEISTASEPIRPVGQSEGAGKKSPDQMSVAEHREAAARSRGPK